MSRDIPALLIRCDHEGCCSFVEVELGKIHGLQVHPKDRLAGVSWWSTAEVDREALSLGWFESEDRREALCPKHAQAPRRSDESIYERGERIAERFTEDDGTGRW